MHGVHECELMSYNRLGESKFSKEMFFFLFTPSVSPFSWIRFSVFLFNKKRSSVVQKDLQKASPIVKESTKPIIMETWRLNGSAIIRIRD